MQNKIKFIIGLIILIIIVGLMYYFQINFSGIQSTATSTNSTATTTQNIGGISIDTNGQGTVEMVPLDSGKIIEPVPDLTRPIIFSDQLSTEAKNILTNNIKNIRDALKKDPTIATGWNNLGINFKIAGDYEDAKIAWEYAVKVNPNLFEAYENLAELYGYYLKDIVKAESADLTAIKIAPDQIFLYFKTASFYKDVLKDKTKAIAIVEQGLAVKNISADDAKSLQALLDSLKK